jgi:hypothetical protein
MHEFHAGQRYFGKPDPEYSSMGMDPVENERTVRLSEVLRRTGAKLIYTYDLGDSWEHAIALEKLLPVDPNASYPVCTDGQRACPPDDCGGIPGFYDLVEAIADPKHEQHKELRDWLGYDFDPLAFSIDSVNQMLFTRSSSRQSLQEISQVSSTTQACRKHTLFGVCGSNVEIRFVR